MTTYTIQAHATSGESYALKYDGDTIVGYCGPLHHSDRDQLLSDPQGNNPNALGLTELDYEPVEDDDFFNRTTWQPPVIAIEKPQ